MKKTSTIIILLSVFYIGCKIHCPEYPAELNYFPYYEGQVLRFTNSQQGTIGFTIDSKVNSKSNSFSQNCKCACGIFTHFSTSINQDSLSIKCEINISGRENASNVSIDCFFYNKSNIQPNEECLYKFVMLEKSVPYDEIYKYLEDTIIIENENNKLVKKVVIVKGKGLVSYTTADGEEWKLVE